MSKEKLHNQSLQESENKLNLSEEQLRLIEMRNDTQLYSYNLTQKLTFFVISIELISCGYILLNADTFAVIPYASVIFLVSGIAAISGILWRVCYNEIYHNNAQSKRPVTYNVYKKIEGTAYSIYVLSTTVFLVGIITIGFSYLQEIENENINIVKRNQLNAETINNRIKGLENSMNNIAKSIESLANTRPKFGIVFPVSGGKQSITQEDVNK
jgi:hypothetical protein